MRLILARESLGPISTRGRLSCEAWPQVFYTIEDRALFTDRHPWGVPFQSCIPEGLYQLVPHSSPKHPDTWAIVNPDLGIFRWPADMPRGGGRYTCLIHAGNTDDDVEGCVAIGLRTGIHRGKPAVFDSQKAMASLRRHLVPGTTHELEIRNPRVAEKCRVT